MAFNPKQHLMKVRGGAEYLEVKWRLVWFREDHTDWGITTKPILVDLEKGVAIFSATITDSADHVIASGTKMETARDFGDFVEKAETGSIGRALAAAGYGTQFAPEMEEGDRIVDAPVGNQPHQSRQASPPKATDSGPVACTTPNCPAELTRGQADYSQKVYGRPMCPACQKRHVRGEGPQVCAVVNCGTVLSDDRPEGETLCPQCRLQASGTPATSEEPEGIHRETLSRLNALAAQCVAAGAITKAKWAKALADQGVRDPQELTQSAALTLIRGLEPKVPAARAA